MSNEKKHNFIATKAYDVSTQKNILNEMFFELLKHMFKLISKKIITIVPDLDL